MKKRKFDAKAMRKFTTEPKVVHEAKPVDLITQYNRMRSIATVIYNSDFFMISSKAEQKKIEASIACISATMISMIGMEAIENSHDCLPDDSGNGNDRSWDNLPDDSGNYTDTDKASHDAIKKMMNIAYGKTESDGAKKASARQVLNSVYGATHPIMAMNRKILSELGAKSPLQKLVEDPPFSPLLRSIALGNVSDDDSDEDADLVNLGNFADGPAYSDQYKHICQIYGFNIGETLKCIVNTACGYTVSKINLVAVVNDKHDIKSDDKNDPKIGDVFFVTNKENDKDPVFVLIYAKLHLESFNIDKVSTEIKPVELEESSKTNYVDFVGSDAYFNIGKVHLNENTIIDLDATLTKIKDEARTHGIDTITFVDTIKNVLDIYTEGKYTLETGSLFFVNNDGPNLKHFILVTKGGDNPGKILARSIDPVEKPDEDPFTFGNESDDDSDGDEVKDYSEVNLGNFISGSFYSDQYRALAIQYGFDMNDTMKQIEKMASQYCIQMINLVDIVDSQNEITADKYTLEPGSVFFVTNKNDESRSPVFMLIYAQPYTKVRSSDISKFSFKIAPAEVEESTKTNDIEFINSDAYFNIEKVHLNPMNPNTVIDFDATLEKIKDEARVHGINTITFVDTIGNSLDIYTEGKYTLEPGSLFCHRGNGWLNFMLIIKDKNTPDTVRFIWPVEKSEENVSLDDIEFVGADAYYKIDKSCPNSDQVIDLDATLIKIKKKAKEEGIKTITFIDTIEGGNHASDKYFYESGALFFVKNTNWVRFELLTKTDFTMFYHINPMLTFESSYNYSVNDQYADVDTSKLNHDIYAGVSFPIFMKPTVTGANVSFADICDIYGFDISETIKRIKNAASLEYIEEVNYIDIFHSFDEIFKIDLPTKYRYCDGYLFFVNDSAKDKQDPCFVILRKTRDNSEIDAILYRINPIKRPASIYCIKKIDVIDTYADGDVRIADGLKNTIDIDHAYKLKEICDKRNYNYDSIISCLKGVTAIIGGGTCLTFEGTVDSLNSIVSVDPVVAYNACSVFFVSGFVDSEKGPYFVIYVPITGKTKNGYNFHLYPIYPIPNQDPNTDSHDDSNVREINQFTTIYRANLEVSEADKDAYMKVEFSNIDYNDREIQSLANICYTWKFKFYDTIKRIRFVAYMSNFEEIKYAGTACSHEEILEKEVLYSNGSVLFVSDAEDPHFVIVEFIHGSTCLIRINPVKE